MYEIKKYVEDETGETTYKIPEYLSVLSFETEKDKEEMKITREEFISKCEEPVRLLFEELEKIANEKIDCIKLIPKQTSYSFRVKTSKGELALLTIYPDSVFIMKYNLTPEKGFKPEAIEAFVEKIKKIEPLSNKYDVAKQPDFKATPTNISRDYVKTFIEAIRELINSLTTP